MNDFFYTSGILLIAYSTLYILTTNTVSVFPAKFIKYSLLLAYFSYLLIVGNSLLTSFYLYLHNVML